MDAAKTGGSATTGQTVVLPFPGPLESIPQATEFRSTWLTSSLEGLRQHGHFERYLTLLEGYQDEILTSVAASWIPLEWRAPTIRLVNACNSTPNRSRRWRALEGTFAEHGTPTRSRQRSVLARRFG